jgi:hypothetical protein
MGPSSIPIARGVAQWVRQSPFSGELQRRGTSRGQGQMLSSGVISLWQKIYEHAPIWQSAAQRAQTMSALLDAVERCTPSTSIP